MKATIRYTKFDGYERLGEQGIVRVSEITHCVPLRGGYSLIMLTTGGCITALESIEELEQRIDAAEGAELEPLPDRNPERL
ncbi:MAG: hypothetical protein ABJB61_13090 [bacterium]